MSENLLALVPNESLPSLRDKFKVNWPEHILAFTFVENIIKFRSCNSDIDDEVEILCLNDEWTKGTFIAVSVRSSHLFSLAFHFDILSSKRKIFSSHLSSLTKRV